MTEEQKIIVEKICDFMKADLGTDADLNTPLLGKDAVLSSLSVMELVAWCEDTFGIDDILEDDLFLDCLTSVDTLARQIIEKGGK